MQIYQDNIAARLAGNTLQPLSGVSITVTDEATNLPASLYSDDGVTPLAQPLTTDADGFFSFAAADGKYTLTFSGTRITTFTRNVVLEDPTDDPYATKTELAAVSGAELIGFRRSFDSEVMTVAQALNDATVENADVVRGTLLTGLSLAVGTAITAADTILSAFGKIQKAITDHLAAKDASGGYAGLTALKINFKNVADTFTSFLTNANTAARTYTFPDKDGTVAMTSDLPSASALTLIATVTPTAAATVDFLNTFLAGYDNYLIVGQGIKPASDSQLAIRFANAGASDAGSNYVTLAAGGSTATVDTNSAFTPGANMTATYGANFTIEIRNANDAAGIKSADVSLGMKIGTTYYNVTKYVHYIAANAISGIRFYWLSGANFAAGGKIRVYGYNNT